MNMEKINEFMALQKELRSTGVIGLSLYDNKVQVYKEALVCESDLQIKSRGDNDYPHEVSIHRDGIKVYCILTDAELKEIYPQLAGYMNEDVDLSGMAVEEHA